MRAALPAALLLALLLGWGGSAAWASGLSNDGTDQALQQELQRLDALRTVDTPAFVAGMAAVAARPLPTNAAQRDYLTFLLAQQAMLSGRFADALAIARPVVSDAEDPVLRFRAGGLLANILAGTREFEEGLRQLGRLLEQARTDDDLPIEEKHRLWLIASIFYNEMGQYDLARRYAEQALSQQPSARIACPLTQQYLVARLALGDSNLREPEFDAGLQACGSAGDSVAQGFIHLIHAGFLRQRKSDTQALSLLNAQLPSIDATAYPRLTAEAHALRAELLLQGGRMEEAVAAAQRALELAKDAPTSTPAAMAHKVLFEAATRQGDSQAALGHLQRHVAASQALAEDTRIKDLAFRTVQHEVLESEQQLALLGERNRTLALQAQVAQAESRNVLLLALLLGAGVLGAGLWTARLIRQERRFRALSQTDALTGFANRAHFTVLAERALARAAAQSRGVALISFDLDHFKAVNDRHGHLAGDAVLRSVSAAVRSVPAEVGLTRTLARMGGEEFALLLEGATAEQAHAHADACREAIVAAQTTLDNGQLLNVTASFGVADAATCGYALNPLLAASDRSLYHAKNDGRNRVAAPVAAVMQAA